MSKVLVADDHLVTRKMLQVILEKNGYQVFIAEDGLRAWEILQTEPGLHLAVIDWMMPGLNGIDICHKLQEERKTALIYVILLTAKEGTDNLIAALQAGANDYATKPFEKEELLARLKVGERNIKLQQQLSQSQKLESIGQLAAGIAHEINTPIQYISDNINFLQDSLKDIFQLLREYEQVRSQARAGKVDSELLSRVETTLQECDMDYLTEEVPRAIQESLEGVANVSRIVQAMKEFAHAGAQTMMAADLSQAIESTITVTRNRWKHIADLKTVFDPDLPLVTCRIDELNQVFLNLIVNAADAIAEKIGDGAEEKGTITVSTRQEGDWAEIRFADTGAGIPEEVRGRILDPFFTTKEVGKGSGQGLAIAHSIIVEKHGGSLTFDTEIGKGTTFLIRLPIEPDEPEAKGHEEEANAICG